MVGGFLIQVLLPSQFWADAAYTTVFPVNRLPLSVIGSETPFQKLFGKPPKYTFLRMFGCTCFPNFLASSQNII